MIDPPAEGWDAFVIEAFTKIEKMTSALLHGKELGGRASATTEKALRKSICTQGALLDSLEFGGVEVQRIIIKAMALDGKLRALHEKNCRTLEVLPAAYLTDTTYAKRLTASFEAAYYAKTVYPAPPGRIETPQKTLARITSQPKEPIDEKARYESALAAVVTEAVLEGLDMERPTRLEWFTERLSKFAQKKPIPLTHNEFYDCIHRTMHNTWRANRPTIAGVRAEPVFLLDADVCKLCKTLRPRVIKKATGKEVMTPDQ